MADRVRCRIQNAQVREDKRTTLKDLIYKLFERRHHDYVGGQEKDWLTMELIQALRRESEVYREALSSQTEGPLPFAVGYFRVEGDRLRLTTREIPGNVAPRTLVRFLSEFLRPGARFWFGEEDGWEIRGQDQVASLDAAASAEDPDEQSS